MRDSSVTSPTICFGFEGCFFRDLSAVSCVIRGLPPSSLPDMDREWYNRYMSGTYAVPMGDRGRIVVPAAVRARAGLVAGTQMVLVESPDGLALLTRQQLRDRVRRDLGGLDLVEELLEDRRRSAAIEDGECEDAE